MPVDERGMLRPGGLDEPAAAFGPQCVETDRDQFEALRMKLVAQRLPPGQVGRASSVGCPGVDDDFPPAQAGEPKELPFQVGQLEVGIFGRHQRA